jgi:hypothetical protein
LLSALLDQWIYVLFHYWADLYGATDGVKIKGGAHQLMHKAAELASYVAYSSAGAERTLSAFAGVLMLTDG